MMYYLFFCLCCFKLEMMVALRGGDCFSLGRHDWVEFVWGSTDKWINECVNGRNEKWEPAKRAPWACYHSFLLNYYHITFLLSSCVCGGLDREGCSIFHEMIYGMWLTSMTLKYVGPNGLLNWTFFFSASIKLDSFLQHHF
jgi:hypothetical protein